MFFLGVTFDHILVIFLIYLQFHSSLPIFENDATMRNLSEKDIGKKIKALLSIIGKEHQRWEAKINADKMPAAKDMAAETNKTAGSPNDSGIAIPNDAKNNQSDAMEISQNMEQDSSVSLNVSNGKDHEKANTPEANTADNENAKAKAKENNTKVDDKSSKKPTKSKQKMNATDGQNNVTENGGTPPPNNDKMSKVQEASSPMTVSGKDSVKQVNTSQASNTSENGKAKPAAKKKKMVGEESSSKPAKRQKMDEIVPNTQRIDDQEATTVENNGMPTKNGSAKENTKKVKPMPKSIKNKREAQTKLANETHDGPSPPKKTKKNLEDTKINV